MRESPVFPVEKNPREFTDWASFINAPPPDIDPFPDKLMCVTEDQGIWPVSALAVVTNEQDMQMQFKEFGLDAEQSAVVQATRANVYDAMVNRGSIAALCVFCIISALILLIVLQSPAGQNILNGINPL